MNFLKNVLIPEKIGNYYLLNKRTIGFDITKTDVSATKVSYAGSKITIDKFVNQPIDSDPNKPMEQRITDAIKIIIQQLGSFDSIRTSLSSSKIIFKELTLPFLDQEKIRLVLNYELEPYLPFSLREAVADFIVINKNVDEKTTTILAAAAKKESIQEHLALFTSAGLTPSVISVDLFDLYSLYRFIPIYAEKKIALVLIELELQATRIAFIHDGCLIATRTLAKGISHWSKDLAHKLNISPNEAYEKIIRFGFDTNNDEEYTKAISAILKPFLGEIDFTLGSFTSKLVQEEPIKQILLLGSGSEITGINDFFQKTLNIPTNSFDANLLLKNPSVTMQNNGNIPRRNIMSLSTALITPTIEDFNLRKDEFALSRSALFYRQFYAAIILLTLFFGTLLFNNWWQRRKLNKNIGIAESEVVTVLKKAGLTNEKTMRKALDEAKSKVDERETIWFNFSTQTRFSILKYLLDLTNALNRQGLGLTLRKLTISQQDNTLSLEGKVKDFEALKNFEKELKQSNLFEPFPSLQRTDFSIVLQIKRNEEV